MTCLTYQRLIQSVKVALISARVGMAGPAPNFVIARKPDLLPKLRASSKDASSRILTEKAAVKQSPAPVESTNLS